MSNQYVNITKENDIYSFQIPPHSSLLPLRPKLFKLLLSSSQYAHYVPDIINHLIKSYGHIDLQRYVAGKVNNVTIGNGQLSCIISLAEANDSHHPVKLTLNIPARDLFLPPITNDTFTITQKNIEETIKLDAKPSHENEHLLPYCLRHILLAELIDTTSPVYFNKISILSIERSDTSYQIQYQLYRQFGNICLDATKIASLDISAAILQEYNSLFEYGKPVQTKKYSATFFDNGSSYDADNENSSSMLGNSSKDDINSASSTDDGLGYSDESSSPRL